jgi:carbon storage regulator CsrA
MFVVFAGRALRSCLIAATHCLMFSPHSLIHRRTTVNIFNQGKNETVVINGDIHVTVLNILDDEVLLAIDAPEWIEVCKKEVLEESETAPAWPC